MPLVWAARPGTKQWEQIHPGTKQREQIHPAAQHGELPRWQPSVSQLLSPSGRQRGILDGEEGKEGSRGLFKSSFWEKLTLSELLISF